jgi:hypothetical protein
MFKKYEKTLVEELGTNPELNGEFFAQQIMVITGRSKAQVSLVCSVLNLPYRIVKKDSRFQKLYDLEVFQTTYQEEKGGVDG